MVTMYELMTDTPPSELMALSAVVLPRLMQARSEVMTREVKTARIGMFQPGATWDSHFENGRPLSRANDQSCLEAVATSLMQQDVRQTMTMPTMKFVAKYDLVPLKKTAINGWPIGVSLIATRSGPTVKQSVIAIRKLKAAFGPTVHMIALGMASALLVLLLLSGVDRRELTDRGVLELFG